MIFIQTVPSGNYVIDAKNYQEAIDEIKSSFDYEEAIYCEGSEKIDKDIIDSIITLEDWTDLLAFCREYGMPHK